MLKAHIRRKPPWLDRVILLGAILMYVGGYAAMRTEHVLVHATAFSTSADGLGPILASHDIVPGDFGVPAEGPATHFATLLAGFIYWPMSQAELLCWRVAQPPGSPYPGVVP